MIRAIADSSTLTATQIWERQLAIRGVGFRCEVKGKQIHMSLGYSHPVIYNLPDGVTAVTEFNPYPVQYPDVSYGIGMIATTATLVPTNTPCRAVILFLQLSPLLSRSRH